MYRFRSSSGSAKLNLPHIKKKALNSWTAVQDTYLSTKDTFERHKVVFTISTSVASVATAWLGYTLRHMHEKKVEQRLNSIENAPTQGAIGGRAAEATLEKYPSVKGVVQNDRPHSNHVTTNENLLRSGQLGMCSDPYCTTCPTYFEGKRKNKKASSVSDQKFRFSSQDKQDKVAVHGNGSTYKDNFSFNQGAYG